MGQIQLGCVNEIKVDYCGMTQTLETEYILFLTKRVEIRRKITNFSRSRYLHLYLSKIVTTSDRSGEP